MLDGFMRVAKENGIMGSFIVAFNMYVKATINQKWQPCNLSFNFVTCCAGCVRPAIGYLNYKKSHRMNDNNIWFTLGAHSSLKCKFSLNIRNYIFFPPCLMYYNPHNSLFYMTVRLIHKHKHDQDTYLIWSSPHFDTMKFHGHCWR